MPKAKFSNEFTYKKYAESGREVEFDRLFDEACAKVKSQFGSEHPIYIAGKALKTADKIVEKSPIDQSILGKFQKAGREETKAAIVEARKALPGWENTDYKERIKIFRKAADIFSKKKFEIAAILSYENGKSRYESIGEVDEAIDFIRYYSYQMEENKGYGRKADLKESAAKSELGFQGAPSSSEKVRVSMRPFGVFGVIAPFNFPISISTGMSTAALITGNTVVFKPSSTDEKSMLTGLKIYEIFKEAGVPDGVFNYLTGPGSQIGEEMVSNPMVSGIVFTGSKKVGMSMINKSYSLGMHKVFVVEMGGKNPTIVAQSADLDAAATGVISAAFGYCGQKCSSLSRVYVHDSVREPFISKLIEKARTLKIGNPLNKETYLGPLVSEAASKTYADAVQILRSSGKILFGGNKVNTGLDGFYVEPTIAEINPQNELFRRELFVPILLVDHYEKFEDAIRKANDTEYGLTAGLYSKKKPEIKLFTESIMAGTVYINRKISATTGAIVGLDSFVGWKDSGITGKGTGSKFYLQQFMQEQSVTITE
jgi:1-pyrroline-5-carboxylate dehydrogenase